MPSIPKQQTFDTIVNHLRTQGARALNAALGHCEYRTPTGMKCAAGCLIPDDKYCRSFEGMRVTMTTPAGVLLNELGHDLVLVQDMQKIHDSHAPHDWEYQFERVATQHGLVLRHYTH